MKNDVGTIVSAIKIYINKTKCTLLLTPLIVSLSVMNWPKLTNAFGFFLADNGSALEILGCQVKMKAGWSFIIPHVETLINNILISKVTYKTIK